MILHGIRVYTCESRGKRGVQNKCFGVDGTLLQLLSSAPTSRECCCVHGSLVPPRRSLLTESDSPEPERENFDETQDSVLKLARSPGPGARGPPSPISRNLFLIAPACVQLKEAAAWRQRRQVEAVLSEEQWSRHKELQAEMFWIGRRGKKCVDLS